MLIYNVTIHVPHAIHQKWVQWMKEKHIPEVMATGCFTSHRFVRILDVDETEAVTYAVQYHAENRETYERYIAEHAPVLRKDIQDTFGDQLFHFRSLMEVVN